MAQTCEKCNDNQAKQRLEDYQQSLKNKFENFKAKLAPTLAGCKIKQGDLLTWVNDYGAEWQSTCIGFDITPAMGGHPHYAHLPQKPLYMANSYQCCYWFNHSLADVIAINGVACDGKEL